MNESKYGVAEAARRKGMRGEEGHARRGRGGGGARESERGENVYSTFESEIKGRGHNGYPPKTYIMGPEPSPEGKTTAPWEQRALGISPACSFSAPAPGCA